MAFIGSIIDGLVKSPSVLLGVGVRKVGADRRAA